MSESKEDLWEIAAQSVGRCEEEVAAIRFARNVNTSESALKNLIGAKIVLPKLLMTKVCC